jgi:GntR family transcriptional regulator
MKIARTNISDEVAAWLSEAIISGRFAPGKRLPSVTQLAQELGVGRSSVREALRHHQALGLIEVQQGKGTFVAAAKPIRLGSSLRSFSEAIRERGMEPGAVVLRREVIVPAETVRTELGLAEDELVNLLQRLRLADGEPLALENSYTLHSLFPDLLAEQWSLSSSLYQILAEKYGISLSYARQTCTAILINEEQSHLLQVKVGSPALEMRTVAYTSDNRAIEYARSVYRGDRYEYTVLLQRRG